MKKSAIGILLSFSLLLLVACGTEKAPTTGGAFLGGTEWMKAAFEPLSILEEGVYTIYDTEDFPLEVRLQNKGEENIPAGKATLRLLGPAREDFENVPSWELSNTAEIEKISEFNPAGGEEIVSFTPAADATYQREVIGYTNLNWNVEYSYAYKTHLIINDVCFKGDPLDDKVCLVKEPRVFSVSGAPITVTSVEEDSAGKGIVLLKIDISNAGTGDATLSGQEFDERFDLVSYTTDEPDRWECKSGGRDNEARLVESKAQIICKLRQPLVEDEIFERSVRLTLDYTYRDLVQDKLRVKESAR